MKQLFAALCLMFWSAGATLAQSLPEPKLSQAIASAQIGVICAVAPDEVVPAPGTVSGTKHVVSEVPPFVSYGRVVPAVLGVGFGISARAADPDGLSTTMEVTHPPFPGSGATFQSFPSRLPGASDGITFYQFDHGYELVTGRWTLVMRDLSGSVLYSVAFDVVPPEQLPQLATACGYSDLLS